MKKNTIFIIPTGIGCTIGGHAGDATPAARLIGEVCDKIILNPNVVNASDINEMPNNALYVEGSILDDFIEGKINLEEVNSNRILVIMNAPAQPQTINAVNAAIVTLGISADICILRTPLVMKGWVENGKAEGEHSGVPELIAQLKEEKAGTYDAVAIASPIDVDETVAIDYFKSKSGVNPWGKIESMVSRLIATALGVPVAHAPIESDNSRGSSDIMMLGYDKVVDPRKSAEVLSMAYIHCILKGLHKAPRISTTHGISRRDTVSCLVTPSGCVGRPHIACVAAGIPVIAVKENKCAFNVMDNRFIYVDNYLEAAGVVACINAGINLNTVRVNCGKVIL